MTGRNPVWVAKSVNSVYAPCSHLVLLTDWKPATAASHGTAGGEATQFVYAALATTGATLNVAAIVGFVHTNSALAVAWEQSPAQTVPIAI